MKFTGLDLRPGDAMKRQSSSSTHRTACGQITSAADGATVRANGIAVSPAIGPLPANYVPRTLGEATSTGLLWQATARAARHVSGWAARRLGRHAGPDTRR